MWYKWRIVKHINASERSFRKKIINRKFNKQDKFSMCSLIMSNSFSTPWTLACQAPLSMGFSKQEYWSGLSLPSPGDLSNPWIELLSPVLGGGFFTTEPPQKPDLTGKQYSGFSSKCINLSPFTGKQNSGQKKKNQKEQETDTHTHQRCHWPREYCSWLVL